MMKIILTKYSQLILMVFLNTYVYTNNNKLYPSRKGNAIVFSARKDSKPGQFND